MPIIVKNKQVQDISDFVPAKPEKKVNLADDRLIAERFSKKKPEAHENHNIVVEPTTAEQRTLSRKFVIQRKELRGVASAENSLVVNGKQKHIGRKSHYLLDMLTLDDE